jgi:carbon-monoxide dehydrogenase iron sulfur subunit
MSCSATWFGVVNPRRSGVTVWRRPFERYERPFLCRHCDEPDCIAACIAGAISKDPETGLVHLAEERCVGCWMCIMVCPHGAVVADRRASRAIKCHGCAEREVAPCVAICPTGALSYEEDDSLEAV